MREVNDGIRLTADELYEKYPNQWLGLVDVQYNRDGSRASGVKSGIVKYCEMTSGEAYTVFADKIVESRFCTKKFDYEIFSGVASIQL